MGGAVTGDAANFGGAPAVGGGAGPVAGGGSKGLVGGAAGKVLTGGMRVAKAEGPNSAG